MFAPDLGWMELVLARGEPASTAGPPTSTPGTCWTTFNWTMGLIRLNGTRRWPCWPALCQEAKRGLSHRPWQGPQRLRCPQVPVLRERKERRSRRHSVGRMGVRRRLLRGALGQVRRAAELRDRPLHLSDPGRRRPHQAVTHGDRGRASRPRQARVVPLRPMIRIRQGAVIRQRSREGAPPLTSGRRCCATSRAPCGGTAYQWPRVCWTVRRWRRAL